MPTIIYYKHGSHCNHCFNAPQVDSAWSRGDRAGAEAASNKAKACNIGGIVCGSITWGIVILIIIISAIAGGSDDEEEDDN